MTYLTANTFENGQAMFDPSIAPRHPAALDEPAVVVSYGPRPAVIDRIRRLAAEAAAAAVAPQPDPDFNLAEILGIA